MMTKARALYLSHGGGPMPLLGDPGHREMVACLENLASNIPKPDTVVVVSAHWEEPVPTITGAGNPPLIYDYYGFPKASYEIEYPLPGEPSLARDIHGLFESAGMEPRLDTTRGFDHGVFVPLKIMYPQADVPCVQVSLVNTLDPRRHMEMGRVLQKMGRENVLVIGSGFSFHNMRAFFAADTAESRALNQAFEKWLAETCCQPDYSEQERAERLARWTLADGARFCHPREEHLLPLHVCYGVAQARCTRHFKLSILNKEASMYLW